MSDDNNECGLAAPAQRSDPDSRVDVSEFAKTAGFVDPVTVTPGVISRFLSTGPNEKHGEMYNRLRAMLWALRVAFDRRPVLSAILRLRFGFYAKLPEERDVYGATFFSQRYTSALVELEAVLQQRECGEPVITIALPREL